MMEKTSSLSKEIALLEQKISFEVNRGKELEVNLASITKTSEEQYNKIKSEKEDEIKAISAKLTNEKVSISEKYQSLKNSSKENDNSQKKIINDLATKVALQEEKLSNLENRLGESERTRENEVTTLKR
jgi:Skp family chaperone for outer membrane proteins